jgi:hypothetical protein
LQDTTIEDRHEPDNRQSGHPDPAIAEGSIERGWIMRRSIPVVVTLVLSVCPVATARGDGLGRTGYETLAGIGISLIIGGLALSVAVILGGIALVRRCRNHSWPAGAWRRIGFVTLLGVLVIVVGPILTVQFGLTTAMVIVGLVLLLAMILGGLALALQQRRIGGRIRHDEMGAGN